MSLSFPPVLFHWLFALLAFFQLAFSRILSLYSSLLLLLSTAERRMGLPATAFLTLSVCLSFATTPPQRCGKSKVEQGT